MNMLRTPILGRFEFVVPSLEESFYYRVRTPSISTDWNTLNPYDPPAAKVVKWNISPPAYTKQDDFEHLDFGYVRAAEGSRIN